MTCEQHNGEATLLIPPKTILLSSTASRDSESIKSSSTIQYQRPFRWQRNFNLTDIRSARVRLSDSITYSASSVRSTSTGSSGVPGIGYLSGKAVKWLGVRILDLIVEPLVISRRRQVIKGLVKQLKMIPSQDRAEWMLKRGRTISRAVEDLLELST